MERRGNNLISWVQVCWILLLLVFVHCQLRPGSGRNSWVQAYRSFTAWEVGYANQKRFPAWMGGWESFWSLAAVEPAKASVYLSLLSEMVSNSVRISLCSFPVDGWDVLPALSQWHLDLIKLISCCFERQGIYFCREDVTQHNKRDRRERLGRRSFPRLSALKIYWGYNLRTISQLGWKLGFWITSSWFWRVIKTFSKVKWSENMPINAHGSLLHFSEFPFKLLRYYQEIF